MMADDGWKALTPGDFARRVALEHAASGVHLRVVPPAGFFEEEAPDETKVRVPPHDLDVEGAVLSMALIDPEALPKIRRTGLLPKDFYSEAHRWIFEACLAVASRPTVTLVAYWLRDNDRLAQAGGMAYLTEVLNAAPERHDPDRYAKILIEIAERRELLFECQRATSLLYLPNGHTDRVLPSLQTAIRAVGRRVESRRTSHNIFDQWRDEGPLVHERTEFGPLDSFTGGGPVYGSRWYLLGAPDACKTAFIVQTADTFARRGLAVGLFAVDEEPSDMQTRIVQGFGGSRDDCELRYESFLTRVTKEVREAHKIPILYFGAGDTVESASDELAEFAKRHGVRSVMFYDSVQTVECDAIRSSRDEPSDYTRVTRNVYAIRAQASKHQHIAVATSEMNRESYKVIGSADARPNGAGKMGAGKQSGAIEYSARVMLSWEKATRIKKGKRVTVPDKFCVAFEKNKHGSSGHFFFVDLDRQRMRLAEGPPPTDDDPDDDEAVDPPKREKRRTQKEALEQAKEQLKARERQAAEDRFDLAVLEVARRTPGIASTDARSEVAAILGGAGRDRFDAAVARLRLKRALRVDKDPRSNKQQLFAESSESPEIEPE